jgi:hypothetical protein
MTRFVGGDDSSHRMVIRTVINRVLAIPLRREVCRSRKAWRPFAGRRNGGRNVLWLLFGASERMGLTGVGIAHGASGSARAHGGLTPDQSQPHNTVHNILQPLTAAPNFFNRKTFYPVDVIDRARRYPQGAFDSGKLDSGKSNVPVL